MTGSVRPRTASLLACGFGALALTATLSACKSSTTTTSAGGSASVAVSTTGAASATGNPGSGAGGTASAQPSSTMSPIGVGAATTPKQQLSAVPAGQKLTAFTTASASADGRTLYVELESMGGACGQYDVVLQESSTSVQVGLVHLASGGHICPQFVSALRVAVSLSAPLAGRPVVDLANGQSLNVG
ncbi:hypothetical protein KDL01_02710 [Actinospica durhamensis]|uniref:Lipoprotein n=1 Tax=Actinospica durhamensis TaxID=1508375 RepID=A0A941INL3_9ACTN|nr:hypothetical protein [Actinospica durhamensis]MBR7832152.1 hypothetical protein [Actinospica durhamensis]